MEDIALVLVVLGLGLLTRALQAHAHRPLDRIEERRLRAAALAGENAAVERVCRTLAREFAQPLTGVVAYSELLTTHTLYSSDTQRRELEGVREGALQMECLLQALRDTLDQVLPSDDSRRVIDTVEQAVAGPRPRMDVRFHAPRLLHAPATRPD